MITTQLAKLQRRGVPQAIVSRLVLGGYNALALPAPTPLPVPLPQSLTPVFSATAPTDPTEEPTRLHDLSFLSPVLSLRLWLALDTAHKQGLQIGCYETLRYPARQEWLFASGRSRSGDIVTNASSIYTSWHGYGMAADCVFIRNTDWYWPPSSSSLWERWLSIAASFGLTTGLHWKSVTDAPHTQPAYISSTPHQNDANLLASHGILSIWQLYDQFSISPSLFSVL